MTISLTTLSRSSSPLELVQLPEIYFSKAKIQAILTSIEGTTSSTTSVKEDLFSYAKRYAGSYLTTHQNEEVIQSLMEEISPQGDSDTVIQTSLNLLHAGSEIAPLKRLQEMIWKEGYEDGTLKGHLYEDARCQLENWHANGIPLHTYSSGSVRSQQDLFSHSIFGNLSHLFLGNFDGLVGGKTESASYLEIAQRIHIHPRNILFLSDVTAELDAAEEAGFETVLVCRNSSIPDDSFHTVIQNFNQIHID